MWEGFAGRGLLINTTNSEEFARRFLSIFGGRQLIHGHTPISAMRRCPPEKVDSPWIYAGGQCVNVDGGMFLGGSGFVYQFHAPRGSKNPTILYFSYFQHSKKKRKLCSRHLLNT